MAKRVGVMLGKFYPIHYGHLHMIFEAINQMDEVHLIVCSETVRDQQLYEKSLFNHPPTPKDRLNWAAQLLKPFPTLQIHHLNEDGLPPYPNGWPEWTERTLNFMAKRAITPTHIFSSEPQDREPYEALFQCPVILVDSDRQRFPISATKIRTDPFRHWYYIPPHIRAAFTRSIALHLNQATPTQKQLIQMLSTLYQIPHLSSLKERESYREDAPMLLFIDHPDHTERERLDNFSPLPPTFSALITNDQALYDEWNGSRLPHLLLDSGTSVNEAYRQAERFIAQLLNFS